MFGLPGYVVLTISNNKMREDPKFDLPNLLAIFLVSNKLKGSRIYDLLV